MNKSILFIYPHDFLKGDSGINVRFCEWATYFKTRGFTIDLLTLKHFESSWTSQEIQAYNEIIRNLHFFDFHKGFIRRKITTKYLFDKIICYLRGYDFNSLPDLAFTEMKDQFERIVYETPYTILFFSYAYWAKLLDANIPNNSIKMLEISDFLTKNLSDANNGRVNTKRMIKEEIRRINRFDEVICIAIDEMDYFKKYAKKPNFTYIPFFTTIKDIDHVDNEKEYDILFIGSDNPHNLKGISWFFKQVYPLINPNIKILIVGSITKYINELQNVHCVNYIKNIDMAYKKSRITICPMLGGTGMKIKVVEALSYGIPVVTTQKGLNGIPFDYYNRFLVTDDSCIFAQTIMNLLENKDYYKQTVKSQYEVFDSLFTKQAIYSKLDKLLNIN